MGDEAEVDGLSEYSNLNQAVSDILKNRRCEIGDEFSKRRRQRLTNEQHEILEFEFEKNPDWSDKVFMKQLSKRLHLSKSKIYKWNWDRKRKM